MYRRCRRILSAEPQRHLQSPALMKRHASAARCALKPARLTPSSEPASGCTRLSQPNARDAPCACRRVRLTALRWWQRGKHGIAQPSVQLRGYSGSVIRHTSSAGRNGPGKNWNSAPCRPPSANAKPWPERWPEPATASGPSSADHSAVSQRPNSPLSNCPGSIPMLPPCGFCSGLG